MVGANLRGVIKGFSLMRSGIMGVGLGMGLGRAEGRGRGRGLGGFWDSGLGFF